MANYQITEICDGETIVRHQSSGGVWFDAPVDQAMCMRECDGQTFYWMGMDRKGMTHVWNEVRALRRSNVQARWDLRCARRKPNFSISY